MDSEMTSRRPQLQVPFQTAPVSRMSAVALSGRTGGEVVPAMYFWEPGYWCERMGVPPQLCGEGNPFGRGY
jgi:hypothetical protein